MEKSEFVKVDLHIHTPSSKCYKGKKDDDEYLNILRAVKSKNIRIIGITDHNTIEGYKKYQSIQERLINEKNKILKSEKSLEAKDRLKEIDKDILNFKDILILPGVEVEVKPGLHLLVIFQENTNLDVIDKFLADGGYTKDTSGEEDLTVVPNWDVLNLYDETEKFECMVIEAHTDSRKGIFNTIDKGSYRASCLKSPQLCAICYRSEEQKDKLQNTLQLAKEYRRQVPLAFVKFSDAHSVRDIGRELTWVRMEEISYKALKEAFKNESELVSTEPPSLAKILDNLLSLNNSFGVKDLSEDNKHNLQKLICALNNSKGGYALAGVTENKKKVGLVVDEIQIKKRRERIEREIKECMDGIDGAFWYNYTVYKWRGDRVIVSLRIYPGRQLIGIESDNRIYSIKNGKLHEMSPFESQLFIEERVTDDIGPRICERIEGVEKECKLIRSQFESLYIAREFERNSTLAAFDINFSGNIHLSEEDIQKLKRAPRSGMSRGNLCFIREEIEPRLPYAYLRYSLPMYTIQNIKRKSIQKETIYIVPGGAVFYSNRDYPTFCSYYHEIIKLHADEAEPYGIKFIVCFLKSSFLLWYCRVRHEEIDLYKPKILENLRLPNINIKNPEERKYLSQIESYFGDILKLEKKYLSQYSRLKYEQDLELTTKNNKEVGEIAYKIDQIIYQLINLSSDDIKIIENNVILDNIYLPRN